MVQIVQRGARGQDRTLQSRLRLFGPYALISLIPIAVLGFVLAGNYKSEAQRRGIAQGRSEALIVARTAVEPLLGDRPLADGITKTESNDLKRLTTHAISDGYVLRLRLRDLAGNVVFSDDGSGFKEQPEDEALDAARGTIVARLTRLNSDSNDTGRVGPKSVEAYVPLDGSTRRIGVLEIYLPYAPINADVTAGLHDLYQDLAIGLALLYILLFLISASVGRGLRREAARNAYLAEHDTLTDLPNRSLFRLRVEQAVESGIRDSTPIVVAIIDLDRFKEVNDTIGHLNGDQLIAELGKRLSGETRPGDTVARLGGDEFGIVLRDVDDASAVLGNLRQVIDNEIFVAGLPITVEASIGYVVAPEDGTNVGELLQRADVAMYVAKGERLGVTRYDRSKDQYDPANLNLIGDLRDAIDAGQLVVHYQPKVNLSNQSVETVEALVRWMHPDKGLIMPDRFIPAAEQTDLIFDLTQRVLDIVLDDLATLSLGVAVAVNVSARSLSNSRFPDWVMSGLERRALSPAQLIIEITETALITDPARAISILTTLDSRGVRVSVDDFGSGQTSLAYLSSLPLHELKIDQSLVSDLLVNSAHGAIVRSIIQLGHDLSFQIVAEGVDSSAVLIQLAQFGCDSAQGYFLAEPMPAEELVPWLENHRSSSIAL